MNNKGQLSVSNLIEWIILILMSAVCTPIARGFINTAIAGTNNSLEILALNGILPVYWILLVGVIVAYARPQAPQY